MTLEDDFIQVQRALGIKGGLHSFIRMAWPVVEPGRAFSDNWHIGAVCEHLEAVSRGQITRLVINMPPGCMKSLACNVFWPAWEWIKDPAQRFFYASFDQRLVGQRDGGKVLELVHSPWFRARWRDRVQIGIDAAAGEFYTQAKGMRFATSPGGRATGYHANKIVLDDLAKPHAITDDYLEELAEWQKQTLASRGLPGAAHVLIMQRLHENDPAGQVLRKLKDDGSREFDHLMLPMRYDAARACSTSIGFKDPRTESGELLWPAYKNEAEVRQIEKDMGSQVASAQLQQSPVPTGGVVFQRDWLTNYYTVAPARFDALSLSFDFTFKDVSKNKGGKIDFVACGAYGRKGADYYLLDLHVERLDFSASLALVKSKAKRWPRIMAKLVEDKANGPAVISMLKKEISGLIPVTPEGGKEARANAVSPIHEARNVWYPDPVHGAITDPEKQNAPVLRPFFWDGQQVTVEPHLDSMAGFPFAAHDDSVDVETQALLYMRKRSTKFLEAMKSLQRSGVR